MPLQHIHDGHAAARWRAPDRAQTRARWCGEIRRRIPGVALRTIVHRRLPRRDQGALRDAVRFRRGGAVRQGGGVRLRARARDAVVRHHRRACRRACGSRGARGCSSCSSGSRASGSRAGRRDVDRADRRPGRPRRMGRAHRGRGLRSGRRRVRGRRGLTPGDLVPVRVTGATAYDLFARVERRASRGCTSWEDTQ